MAGEPLTLREAAQAYIDWRDKRMAQWDAVARHDHEHGMTPCPEWDELTGEPFDIDQRLDDELRSALRSPAATDERDGLLRAAIESAIRQIEAIPHSADVEQAGMQAEVVIAELRAALSPDERQPHRHMWQDGDCIAYGHVSPDERQPARGEPE